MCAGYAVFPLQKVVGEPELSIAFVEDEYKMPPPQVESTESNVARRQVVLGLVATFSIYAFFFYHLQTMGVARPRMAAELHGMALFGWLISIPGLAGALGTLFLSKLSDLYGRRLVLMVSLSLALVGSVMSALSPTIVVLIIATTIGSLGLGAVIPLALSVLGDMFAPAERSKWVGMLNIPGGMFSLLGPTLGGWLVDNLSWRHIFWIAVPLTGVCLLAVPLGIPRHVKKVTPKIDVVGSTLIVLASSALILALSFAGLYPWVSLQVAGLLVVSIALWALFVWSQGRVVEPFLDPQLLRNRTFRIVLVTCALATFGQTAIMMYYPLFLQGVQGISATRSGQILTPFGVLMSFGGVPTGFLIARTKRFKKLFIGSYALLAVVMWRTVFFTHQTSIAWGIAVATLTGLGFGALPTITTLVAQCAVPKRILGAAMGVYFFNQLLFLTISSAVLGSILNVRYAATLKTSLPQGVTHLADKTTIHSLGDPSVLLLKPAMKALQGIFDKSGSNGQTLFTQTIDAVRLSLQSGLTLVFLIAAVTMLLAFVLILRIPEMSIDTEVRDERAPEPLEESRLVAERS
jgi:MFS family permease